MFANAMRRRRGVAIAVLALVVAALTALCAPAASAGEPKQCKRSDDPYAMTLVALTGPEATDLSLTYTALPGCGDVTRIKHLQIKTHRAHGRHWATVDLDDVPLADGVATVALDRVARGQPIKVKSEIQAGTTRKTHVLRGATVSRLRPDLVVTGVDAPRQTLVTRSVDVSARISETLGDSAATMHVVLASPIAPLSGPVEVSVPAGGDVTVTFPGVALTEPASTELRVMVTDAAPTQYDNGNDQQAATVEVTRNELLPLTVLVPSLGGYGFQLNQHLYAPITNPAPATLPDLESKVQALEPQLVRIFYNENWEANANGLRPEWTQNLESFKKTVELAQQSGATMVIAYQTTTTAKTNPTLWMGRFADVLQDLVVTRGLTNVRWALIQNEPNSTNLTLAQYRALYDALRAALDARGLQQIRLIGGDLVESGVAGHRVWFDYMTANMNDVVDAWSEHIYWNYWDHFRMEERLKDVAYLVRQELPESARKPTFVLEYGVRGMNSCGTKPAVTAAYYNDAACTELRRMSLAGFHKLWFTVLSAQLGFDGLSSWDLYWSVYDLTKNAQSYWTIGPPEEGWALYPSYYAFQLLLQTTARGWQVLAVDPFTEDDGATRIDAPHPDQLEQELTAYKGPDGQLTVVGLDTNGGTLVEPNGQSSSYSVGGLPPFTTFTLALWNGTGDGTSSVDRTITTGAAGVARFDVPLQAAFVLTTVPVS
jgi:hypothetical protein